MLLSPYFAIAQYGFSRALFRYRSIRAQSRPISLSLNTGSFGAYVLTSLRAYGASYAIAPGGGNTLRGYGYVLGLLPCAHTP